MKKRLTGRLSFIALAVIVLFPTARVAAIAVADSNTVYQWNLSVYNSKSTDEATLAYYRLPGIGVYSDDEEAVNLALSITAGKTNDYEKVRAIHDWVAGNVWYDLNSVIVGSTGVLANKRTVCQGYSNLTAALLRASGIPAKVVTGFASTAGVGSETAENHAWNEAYADGRWIILDTTWDSNNKYENGVYSKQATCRNDYFDISLQDISKDHRYLDYTDYYVIDRLIIDGGTNVICGIHDFLSYKDNVEEIAIPDGVMGIGGDIFNSCKSLRSVTISQSVKSIGDYAFSFCPNLSSIVIPNSVAHIESNVFERSPNVVLYGNAGSYAETYAKENSLPFVAETLNTASEWARPAITSAVNKGFVPEDLQDNYTDTITRAEFCRLAMSYIEYATGKDIDAYMKEKGVSHDPGAFTDTSDPYILAAFALGVTTGTGNNQFTPDGQFSRESAAGMLKNVCAALGRDVGGSPDAGFNDTNDISAWTVDGVNYCVANGIMRGGSGNMFDPKGTFTREMSIMTFDNMKHNELPGI